MPSEASPMTKCLLCLNESTEELLDLGDRELSNRFLRHPTDAEYTHPFRLGLCHTCGTVQVVDPPPPDELRPRFDWITYREPEDHLDDLADRIAGLPGISSGSAVCGLSFKDDSLLERLRDRGFAQTRRLDPTADLGIEAPGAGIETIQESLNPDRARRLASTYGKADIVIARHLLEHCQSPSCFIGSIKEIVRPGGYVVVEVPDCEGGLEDRDYSSLWEEHCLYFTPETFAGAFPALGLSLTQVHNFPYAMENCLIGIGQVDQQAPRALLSESVLEREVLRARRFAQELPATRDRVRDFLASFRRITGTISMFGAGHRAVAFIDVLGLRDCLECVLDDNPMKQDLFLPGSHLPIRPSGALLEEDHRLCLMTLNPDSESKVMDSNRRFLDEGGRFASIYPGSRNALEF